MSRSPSPEEARRAVEDAAANGRDKEFWDHARGLTAIRDWARARRAGPYALLGEVLLQVAARIPPQIVLPPLGNTEAGAAKGTASLNHLIASVGPSGLSKGLGHQLSGEIVLWPPAIPAPVYSPMGSGEGIAATYVVCERDEDKQFAMRRLTWSAVFTATEIDRFAALMGRRQATLGGTLRAAWSGEPLGDTNATEERRRFVPRNGYRAGVMVHVQPGRGGALLNPDEVAGGTPQRTLWLPAVDPDIPDIAPAPPDMIRWVPPDEVVLAIAQLEAGGLDQLGSPDLIQIMPVCTSAREAIDRAAVARHRGEADPLDGHALLVREKLAAVLAAFLGRFGVTDEDWQLAGDLMAVSDSTRAAVAAALRQAEDQRNEARGNAEAARARMVDSAREAQMRDRASARIAAVLGKANGSWLARGRLRAELSAPQRDYFFDAIEILIKNGKVSARDTQAGHGVASTEYRSAQ